MAPVVLCINDRQELLALRKETLERLGCSVLTAKSSVEGMKILRQIPIDAVLIEYQREGMDAEAMAFHIKWLFPKVPIVLLSAFAQMPERILWLVDEYVMKSVKPDELVRTIGRLTRKKPVTSISGISTAISA